MPRTENGTHGSLRKADVFVVCNPLTTRLVVRQEELFWRERQAKLKMLAEFEFTKSLPPSIPKIAAQFPPKQALLDVNMCPQVVPCSSIQVEDVASA